MITRKTFTLKRILVSLVSGTLGAGVSVPSLGNYYNDSDYCYNNPYAYNCPCYNYNYNNQYCPYYNNSYNNENYLLDALLIASVVGIGLAIVNSINNNNNYYYNNYYPYNSYPYATSYNPIYTNYRPYQNYYHPNYPYNYLNKESVWAPMKNAPMVGYPGKQNLQQPWTGGPQGVGATQKGMPWGGTPGGAKAVGAPPSAMPNATKGLKTSPPGGMTTVGAPPPMQGGTKAVVPGKSFHQNFKGAKPPKMTPMPFKAPKSFYNGRGHVNGYFPQMRAPSTFRQAMPSQFRAMPAQHMMMAPRSFAPAPMRLTPMPAAHGIGGLGGFHPGAIHMHGR